MHIHKGNIYTITTDGITVYKSDGRTVRNMKYYPERDVAALAGEIDELTAWQILSAVATQANGLHTPISPDHIFIDGKHFVLSEWSESKDERFVAPEGYSSVWALAATIFYVYLGCHVFQGLGGKGQTKTAPIPTLRRELPELSNLIIKCLDFIPANRPDMSEIARIAEINIKKCKSKQEDFPPLKLKKESENTITADDIDTYWPEEMC